MIITSAFNLLATQNIFINIRRRVENNKTTQQKEKARTRSSWDVFECPISTQEDVFQLARFNGR